MSNNKPHYSFIKFPKTLDEQREYIIKKAQEKCGKSVCINTLNSFCRPATDFKELIERIDEVVMETEYWE